MSVRLGWGVLNNGSMHFESIKCEDGPHEHEIRSPIADERERLDKTGKAMAAAHLIISML